jgi:hypothetical protein
MPWPRTPWPLGALAAALLVAPTAQGASIALRPVALSGQPADGTPAGVAFLSFDGATLGAGGEVALLARVAGPGIDTTNDRGIWRHDGASAPELVARAGDPVLGAGPDVFFGRATWSAPVLGPAGEVVFSNVVVGGAVATGTDTALFRDTGPGGPSVLLREGDPAPGLPGLTAAPSFPQVDGAGRVAFRGALAGPGVTLANDQAVFLSTGPGAFQPVVREGDAAPGTPSGVVLGGNLTFDLADGGRLAVRGGLAGPGVTTANDGGLWGPDEMGGLALVAREGDQAAGFAEDVRFTGFGTALAVNDDRQVAFYGSLAGFGIVAASDSGVWRSDGAGGLELLGQEGRSAPDLPAAVHFGSFSGSGNPIALNDRGHVAFVNRLAGLPVDVTNDFALFGPSASGDLRLVARESDPVPELLGVSFLLFSQHRFDLNARGDLAFGTWLDGAGVVEANDEAIFFAAAGGDPMLVVREGDLLELAPGVSRAIVALGISTFDSLVLNDRREILFFAELADGSEGWFVAKVHLPEPPLAALAVAAALYTIPRSRKARRSASA